MSKEFGWVGLHIGKTTKVGAVGNTARVGVVGNRRGSKVLVWVGLWLRQQECACAHA